MGWVKKLLALSVVLSALVAPSAWAAQTILVFGDSLSAAYGLEQTQGWVSLLQDKLSTRQGKAQVVNASISGETTSGGASRIDETLKQHQPDIVLLELGANDGLRGLSLSEMQKNLTYIITTCNKAGAKVVLIGMKIPPNYGLSYTQQFSHSFTELAQRYKTALVPFFLEHVGGNPSLTQADGLHPTAQAQPILLANVWPALAPLLKNSP